MMGKIPRIAGQYYHNIYVNKSYVFWIEHTRQYVSSVAAPPCNMLHYTISHAIK